MKKTSSKRQIILIFLAWFVYVCSYVGRSAVNANVIAIQEYFSVSKTEVGLIGTYFFVAYGIGQFVNGMLCKYYNPKYVITCSLTTSSILSLIIFFDFLPFGAIKYIWFINGAVLSMLWTSIISTLSKSLDQKYITIAIVVTATTVAAGTFISYGLSALFSLFKAFKLSFLFGAIFMVTGAFLWFSLYNKLTKNEKVECDKPIQEQEKTVKAKVPKDIRNSMILFAFIAIIINFVKDGITTWVPDVLNTSFALPESLSIILSIVLPLLAVFGAVFGSWLNKYIKNFPCLVGTLFAITSVFIFIVVLMLKSPMWYLTIIAFGICSLVTSASNNVVTSIMPFSYKDRVNSGFVAGILNGFCSVGSALSPSLMGAMFEYFNNWHAVFVVVLGLALVAMLVCYVVFLIGKLKKNKI